MQSNDMESLNLAGEHSTSQHKKIRSFVLRTGRVTTGQQRAFDNLGQTFLLSFADLLAHRDKEEQIDWSGVFGRNAPLTLEIGFGMGEATAHIAQLQSDTNFLCCEVHTPGVGALLKRIGEANLQNIRILQHDAVEVLEHLLAHDSLDAVHIFFPDPWHKKRHHKRRLIQAPLVQSIAQRLKPGGYIHAATDWQEYAEQILSVMQEQALLENTAPDGQSFAPQPAYRPRTKFENRGLRLGHGVWDIVFRKR